MTGTTRKLFSEAVFQGANHYAMLGTGWDGLAADQLDAPIVATSELRSDFGTLGSGTLTISHGTVDFGSATLLGNFPGGSGSNNTS